MRRFFRERLKVMAATYGTVLSTPLNQHTLLALTVLYSMIHVQVDQQTGDERKEELVQYRVQ